MLSILANIFHVYQKNVNKTFSTEIEPAAPMSVQQSNPQQNFNTGRAGNRATLEEGDPTEVEADSVLETELETDPYDMTIAPLNIYKTK